MLKSFNFRDFITHFRACITVILETTPFIRKHKLWKGFFDHKWVTAVTIIIALIFTYVVYGNLKASFAPDLDEVALASMSPELEGLIDDAKESGKRGAYTSGTKYMLLIILEVIIFHFSVKTLTILSNNGRVTQFKDFVNAEKRMIKIMVLNFGKGLIVNAVLYVAFSLIDFDFLTKYVMFFVYAYFIGYAFLDNYNEQFVKTIKNSQAIIRQHVGATTALGLLITILLYVPIVGPIIGPIFGSIAGAIYGERYKIENAIGLVGLEDEEVEIV